MTQEDIIRFIKKQKESHKLDEEWNQDVVNHYCEGIGVTEQGLIYTLVTLYINSALDYENIYKAFCDEHEKTVALKGAIDQLKQKYGLNGNQVQRAKIESGLPIAKKQGTVQQLKSLMELGVSDADIMKQFKISKTTLWRWKKKLEERS